MNLRFQSLSLAGPHGENQDCVLEPINSGVDWWCAIADGVGGTDHGGDASRTCIDALKLNVVDDMTMRELFGAVSNFLKQRANDTASSHRMGSTLSILRLSKGQAFVGHVGDTRIMHYRGGGVMARTHDQTEVQKLLDEGAISKHQARRYPRRNIILSVMSPYKTYDLHETTFTVKQGDRILLTTDGFHSKLQRRNLARLSSSCASFNSFFKSLKDVICDLRLNDDATCLAIEIE